MALIHERVHKACADRRLCWAFSLTLLLPSQLLCCCSHRNGFVLIKVTPKQWTQNRMQMIFFLFNNVNENIKHHATSFLVFILVITVFATFCLMSEDEPGFDRLTLFCEHQSKLCLSSVQWLHCQIAAGHWLKTVNDWITEWKCVHKSGHYDDPLLWTNSGHYDNPLLWTNIEKELWWKQRVEDRLTVDICK